MRKGRKTGTRLLSLLLVLFLALGSAGAARAQEEMPASIESGGVSEETDSAGGADAAKSNDEAAAESNHEGTAKSNHKAAAKSSNEGTATDNHEGAAEKTGCGLTATLRVDGYGKSVAYPTQVTLPDTYKTFADYGITGVEDPGYYTVMHLMAQYCEDTGKNPADEIQLSNGFLNDYLHAGSGQGTFFMFMVNNAYQAEGTMGYTFSDCPVKNGDYAVVYDWYWSTDSVYAYFSDEAVAVNANELFTVTLNANNGMSALPMNASGADIIVQDENGREITDSSVYSVSGKTDKKGQTSLSFFVPGTYLLTAERKNANGMHEMNRPYARVTVGEPIQLTDEQAVSGAARLMSIGDTTEVVQDIQLPSTGRYDTTVEWKSSDAKIVGDDGKVTRPVDSNPSVTLTATITKGAASAVKEFTVTVKGKTTDLAYLSVNHGKLQFDPAVRDYILYVPEKDENGNPIEELEVTARPTDDALWFLIDTTKYTTGLGNVFERETKTINIKGKDKISIAIDVVAYDQIKSSQVTGTTTIIVKRAADMGEPLPDLPDIEWGQHLGDKSNNAVVSAKAPTKNGALLWESFSNAPEDWGRVEAGTPILVNKNIYIVQNNRLQALDAKTGKVQMSSALDSDIGFYANITYGGGMVFVPLGNGQIQCFNAATLESMYLTEQPGGALGLFSIGGSIHYGNGSIYVGYSDYAGNGYFAAYDTVDLDTKKKDEIITPRWTSGTGDYYGTGAVTVGNYVIFAGDKGVVSSVDARSGKEADTCQLKGSVSGAAVYTDGAVWIATKEKLYKLTIGEDGQITEEASAALPLETNASPAVAGGKVYMTGGDYNGHGFLAVYDLNLKELAVKMLDYKAGTPTVTTAYEDAYVYFAQNAEKGALSVAKVTADNKISVRNLYVPVHSNYSMSKVIIASDGTIYYTNDAGYLYAVTAGPEAPASGEESKPGNKDNGNASKDGGEKKTVLNTADFAPVKRTIKMRGSAAAPKKTESEKIAGAIADTAGDGKTSLTIKNVPEVLEPSVFAELAGHPEFRLVLDCGAYTISMKGSDVTDKEASLHTTIRQIDEELPDAAAKKLGDYQRLELKQDGAFPGKITVVYTLPEQLADSEQLYLYEEENLEEPENVTKQEKFAMFVLKAPGAYILAENRPDTADGGKPDGEIDEALLGEDMKKEKGLPQWAVILLSVAGGVVVGAVAVGTVTARKRKKGSTWEEE